VVTDSWGQLKSDNISLKTKVFGGIFHITTRRLRQDIPVLSFLVTAGQNFTIKKTPITSYNHATGNIIPIS
jgi:hypothetical protein